MTGQPEKYNDEWQASWESNEAAQLDSWLSSTPIQRLEWLEEALLLAYQAGALPMKDHQ